MILNVMQAAATSDPAPWWMVTESPWWAAPVATLAGAVLAWALARLTSGRAEKIAARKEALAHRRTVYLDYWSAVLDHTTALASEDETAVHRAISGVAEALFPVELVGSAEVVAAATTVKDTLKHDAPAEVKGEVAKALRAAIAADLRAG